MNNNSMTIQQPETPTTVVQHNPYAPATPTDASLTPQTSAMTPAASPMTPQMSFSFAANGSMTLDGTIHGNNVNAATMSPPGTSALSPPAAAAQATYPTAAPSLQAAAPAFQPSAALIGAAMHQMNPHLGGMLAPPMPPHQQQQPMMAMPQQQFQMLPNQQQHQQQQQHHHQGGRGERRNNNHNRGDNGNSNGTEDGAPGPINTAGSATTTYEELAVWAGSLVEHARTSAGSSFIQCALKDNADPRNVELIWTELVPALGDLLLDAHGCYVIKSLLDRLPASDVKHMLGLITADEALAFSMCTHSLHTRRVVQHIIENLDGSFLCGLMMSRCVETATTQQGCIVMQRSMDHTQGQQREKLLEVICSHIVQFAQDPFANYVVQHLMEVGERETTSANMWKSMQGSIILLSCNKFASNVIEKCLFHVTAKTQHDMLVEMYSAGPQTLYDMLQDSFGNYIIQSSIALATFRDVSFIDEKLRPVLVHTPYGHKIEARLDRRLKGKAVTARSPLLSGGGGSDRPRRGGNNGGGRNGGGRGGKQHHQHQQQHGGFQQQQMQPHAAMMMMPDAMGHMGQPMGPQDAMVPEGEVPW